MSLIVGVPGIPAPQGSFRPMVNKYTGKPVLVAGAQSGYLRYRADIRTAAQVAMREQGYTILSGAVGLYVAFTFPRPDSHWLPVNSRRDAPALKPGAPQWLTSSPDVDKLCRAVLDALTGIAYLDDAQVTAICGTKVYSDEWGQPGFTAIAVTHEPVIEASGVTH